MLDNLLTMRRPPDKRLKGLSGELEEYLSEGAVAMAFAMHLLRTTVTRRVEVHPDGQHSKNFDFRVWLSASGYVFVEPSGKTSYGGIYRHADGREIEITPKSGLGDIVAQVGNSRIIAEAKGGVVNTKHAGQVSRLRRGLCEAVGLLMATERKDDMRQVAVVPKMDTTVRIAERMIPRARQAGIEIALVDGHGNITEIQ
jgi:hypothetical protein